MACSTERDTGVGIPAWAQQRLFELGFTTSKQGSGLGLTLVKKIVEDHGGYVEVESEEGVGSVFGVYVPA